MNLFFSGSCVFFLRDTLCMKLSLYTLCLYSVWFISICFLYIFFCTHTQLIWLREQSLCNYKFCSSRRSFAYYWLHSHRLRFFFSLLLLVVVLLLCVRLSLHGWNSAVLVRILTDCLADVLVYVLVCVCARVKPSNDFDLGQNAKLYGPCVHVRERCVFVCACARYLFGRALFSFHVFRMNVFVNEHFI